MKLIAESEGATPRDAVRLAVYVTDMCRFRPFVNKVQEELWGAWPYAPWPRCYWNQEVTQKPGSLSGPVSVGINGWLEQNQRS